MAFNIRSSIPLKAGDGSNSSLQFTLQNRSEEKEKNHRRKKSTNFHSSVKKRVSCDYNAKKKVHLNGIAPAMNIQMEEKCLRIYLKTIKMSCVENAQNGVCIQ